jgi:hypothetical protein
MRAVAIEISEVPLSQTEILSRQTSRVLASQDLDAVVFWLARGPLPIPERGGSGFILGPDPAEGISADGSRKMLDHRAARPIQLALPAPLERSFVLVQLSPQTYDIQLVREVLPCVGGMQVVFPTRLSACSSGRHADYV